MNNNKRLVRIILTGFICGIIAELAVILLYSFIINSM